MTPITSAMQLMFESTAWREYKIRGLKGVVHKAKTCQKMRLQ
jgi:hypothetical protein